MAHYHSYYLLHVHSQLSAPRTLSNGGGGALDFARPTATLSISRAVAAADLSPVPVILLLPLQLCPSPPAIASLDVLCLSPQVPQRPALCGHAHLALHLAC